MTKPISQHKLKSLIREEKAASREYHKLGFHKLARDEHGHHEFLEKIRERKE